MHWLVARRVLTIGLLNGNYCVDIDLGVVGGSCKKMQMKIVSLAETFTWNGIDLALLRTVVFFN